jgi:hypothetical protein
MKNENYDEPKGKCMRDDKMKNKESAGWNAAKMERDMCAMYNET